MQGLDEVMDWPAVSEPAHPGYQRMWESIQAARDSREVIDGHGSGLTEPGRINASAAAGLSSDHSIRQADEAWEKLQHGLFLRLKDDAIERPIPLFVRKGLKDMRNLVARADYPGYPRAIITSLITCSPNTWRLVVPHPGNPSGLVLLQNGRTMPVAW